jgi:hypothetical protein
MATRVDPKQYGDTPIFQGLLEERRGRWPGIPMEELPALPVPHDGAPYTLPVMSRVQAVRSSRTTTRRTCPSGIGTTWTATPRPPPRCRFRVRWGSDVNAVVQRCYDHYPARDPRRPL